MDLSTQLLSNRGYSRGRPQVVDLRSLVAGLDLGRFYSGDTVFCTNFATVTCPVRVDSVPLEEVVVGLALNAREAVRHAGTVMIRIDRPSGNSSAGPPGAGWVLLEVSDSGRRMDRETRSRVSSPFSTVRGLPPGRGMGLSVACGVVRQSGGTVRVSSAPGCGMTVRVWLPVAAPR